MPLPPIRRIAEQERTVEAVGRGLRDAGAGDANPDEAVRAAERALAGEADAGS